MKLLGKLDTPDFTAGIFPDIEGEDAPLIRYAENAVFEARGIRPVEGQLLRVIPPTGSSPVLGVLTQQINGAYWVIWSNAGHIYGMIWPAGATLVLSGLYALSPVTDFVSFVSWGTWTVAANGKGRMQLRQGPDALFADLDGGSSTTVRIVVRRSPFLFAMGLDTANGGPTGYQWCAEDDIQTWTPGPDNQAGGNVLRDVDSDITCGLEWRGEVVALTQNSLTYLPFVGGNDVFGQKQLLKDIGAVGQKAACVVGDLIYGFGQKGFWRSDGASAEYLDTPAITEFVWKLIEPTAVRRVCVAHDRLNERVLLNFPARGSSQPNRTMAWSSRYSNWQFFKYGRTCYDAGDGLPAQVFGAADGGIYEQSQAPLPPSGSNAPRPMELDSRLEFTIGYGKGKYGRMPYGGKYKVA